MLQNKRALLLIGSPKTKGSTSFSIGNYLLESLKKKGFLCEKIQIFTEEKDNKKEVLDKVKETDLLIITAPLYVDSLPAPLICTLEYLNKEMENNSLIKKRSLVGIVNSGFPEASQNNVALKICKKFGDMNNFKWLGGLAMGCGPAINGRPIEELGGMTRNIVKALDMAAHCIAADEAISKEAIDFMAKKMFPIWMYLLYGNRNWKTLSKKFNSEKILLAKPYGY